MKTLLDVVQSLLANHLPKLWIAQDPGLGNAEVCFHLDRQKIGSDGAGKKLHTARHTACHTAARQHGPHGRHATRQHGMSHSYTSCHMATRHVTRHVIRHHGMSHGSTAVTRHVTRQYVIPRRIFPGAPAQNADVPRWSPPKGIRAQDPWVRAQRNML